VSGASTTFTTARFLTADYLVRGRANTLSCPLWRDGALVAPTQAGSTVTLYDAGNNVVVNGAAVTVTGSIATYTVSADTLPSTLSLGMGWRVEWSLVLSGVATQFRNNAGLVRSELAPVITDRDLFRRESSLDPSGSAPITSLTDFQDYIDEAWVTLIGRMVGKGSLPHLVMEPSALREVHLTLALKLLFSDSRTGLDEAWRQKALDYGEEFKAAWNELRFEYDTTDSGQSDGRKKRSAHPTVFTCGRG
jgi:hypothetical protein